MPEGLPPGASRLPFKLPIKKLLLVLGVVATLYAALLLFSGNSPKAALSTLWSWTGLQAAALCVLNYVLRGMRWRLWMAQFDRHFSALEGLRLYLAGYAFTPTPGNIGEAIRGMMLARNPLGTAQSQAIFGAERLADLLCLLLLCLPAISWALLYASLQIPAPLVMGLAAGAALLLVLTLALLFANRSRLLARFAWLQGPWTCLATRPMSWFVLTLAAWAAQGVAVWLICRALSIDVPMLVAIGFYAVAMVAGALSALPAGLGGTEVVLTGLLVAHGAAPAAALTLTVLARLLTLWLAVAIGVVALLYSAAIRKDISFS